MEKCKCGKTAVIFRKYEGRYLCEKHFCESIERKTKRTIRESKMVQKGDRIVVALSGGKDSVSLLYIMNKTFGNVPGTKIIAISIDEGIKDARTKALVLAKKWCKEWKVEHKIYSFKKEFGKTMDQKVKELRRREDLTLREPCTYCGVGRRYMMNKIARKLKANKLCVGHNLDDESQAALMNYIRGDLGRASRMSAVTNFSLSEEWGSLFVPRIKPFRMIPEEEVALYAKIMKFGTSEKWCPYKSGVRKDVLIFLNQLDEKYPGVKFSILETFDKIVPNIRNIVRTENKKKLIRCKKCKEPSAQIVCKTCELWR